MSAYEELHYREGFAGGCLVEGKETCVAQPEEGYCDEGTFKPAHWLRANSGTALRYCAGDLFEVMIGRCGGVDGKCTNLQSRCGVDGSNNAVTTGTTAALEVVKCDDDDCNHNANKAADEPPEEDKKSKVPPFVQYDPTCTVTQDLLNDVYVTYGKCGTRCVWSSDDCLDGEGYTPWDDNCTAEKVEIGACFGGHAFCSVSPLSCTHPGNPDEPWWTHQDVQEKIGANCYLSRLPTTGPIEVATSSSSLSSSASPPESIITEKSFDQDGTPILVHSSSSTSNTKYSNAANGGLGTGGLIGIVATIAVVIGIGIGVGSVWLSIRRKNRYEKENAWKLDTNNSHREHHTLPVEDIELSYCTGSNNNNNGDAMVDGNDVAPSELSVEIN